MASVFNSSNLTSVLEKGAIPQQVTHLTFMERVILASIFAFLLLASVIGNLAAILVTIRRNHRFIQKTSIVSLSLGDLCMTLAYSVNNLETFSHPMVNWTLGEFACSFIPMAQIFGLVVNLASMVVVATDRYRNVVKVLAHRWNPSRWKCLLGFAFIWLASFGISYPIFPMYKIKILRIFFTPKGDFQLYEFCISDMKKKLELYYIVIAALVFSTLWCCFIFLNCSIAHLVWKLRKPVGLSGNNYEDSFSNETSMTHCTSSSAATPQQLHLLRVHAMHARAVKQLRNKINVERKMRTFKIIVALMCTFTVCRLPFWIFNILKLSESYTEHRHWLIMYGVNALALLNCVVNPLLYSFLQPTLAFLCRLLRFVDEFAKKVCCWYCTATEFEEFGKENPFCPDAKAAYGSKVPRTQQPLSPPAAHPIPPHPIDDICPVIDAVPKKSYNVQRY